MRHVLIAVSLMVFMCGSVSADEIDDIIPFVIQVESGGDPNAVSRAGAVGLMQITPIVLAEFKQYQKERNAIIMHEGVLYVPQLAPHSIAALFIPQKNVWLGEWYLRRLKDHYMKNEMLTLMPEAKEGIGICYAQYRYPDDIFQYVRYNSDQDLCLILAAYNGGITRLRNSGYDINKMPRETRSYVKKVMKLYKEGQ